jgi:class 3 adenylate cyclase
MGAENDVSELLANVRIPTLVLHRTGDKAVAVVHGRYIAQLIPGSRYIELEGEDHFWHLGDADSILGAIEEFLTGTQPVPPDAHRVLATVLFTDIVASTDRAAEVGDRQWKAILDDHDALVRRQLERFRGREIKTTGDGFLATFDGPARAIHSAAAIVDGARGLGLDLRAGLHTGECEVRGDDLGGIAVHIASRVATLAEPGEILVSGSIPPLVVGSQIKFASKGIQALKGVPGKWTVLAVER